MTDVRGEGEPVKVVRAAWVCPVASPPIAGGWVAVAGDRIAAVGGPGDPPPAPEVRDLGRVAVLPGLVNAHTHIELSWLRNRVPPAVSFMAWLGGMFAARGSAIERIDDPRVAAAAAAASREAKAAGTVAVADIGNSLASVPAMAATGLDGVVFHELLGFGDTSGAAVEASRRLRTEVPGSEAVSIGIAPHAPYSVSPELFRAIRCEADETSAGLTSVHVGESPEEMVFLAEGTGPWPGLLRRLGAWRDDWRPPGTGPVAYLDGLGVLGPRTLAVHGVQLEDGELALLAERGCTLVTCPRSNQWVGVGAPPVARFYASGVRVAVGTDSLASVADMNLFAELRDMRWLAPDVPARRLIESATLNGAHAIGREHELGSIEAGKRAALIAVSLGDEAETDVEEYLVSGISARQVAWIA